MTLDAPFVVQVAISLSTSLFATQVHIQACISETIHLCALQINEIDVQ